VVNPTRVRLWIEIVAVFTGIACVLAVFYATLGAAAGGTPAAAQSTPPAQTTAGASQTYEGMVTDTRCTAKHTPAIPESAADCVRTCVHAGEHFALVDGDKLYILEGEPESLKRVAGERATVSGMLNGNTISVASVRSTTP
jgi:hypothetical protein